MPEINAITVKGFKSLANIINLPLKSINIIIGPNGSGKSNFIGAFEFLHAIREGHLQDYIIRAGGADKVLHFGSKITQKLQIQVSFNDDTNQYEIVLQPTDSDELVPQNEIVSFWNKSNDLSPYKHFLARQGKEAGISAQTQTEPAAAYVRHHLDRWRLYHFHDTSASSPMKKTTDVNDNRYLRPDGSNIAAFLYLLRNMHEPSYSLIRRTVQRVAPFFDDFILEPQRLNENKIRLEWRHKGSEGYFGASALSDGTLRFIALATLFLQPDDFKPSVILVDEPELGLHPYAITMLASLIKQASQKIQVIVSTQSPLLLDHFEPDDVLVADRVNGGTQLTRLGPTSLSTWQDEYSLGQLWEKNEIGGRPTAEQVR